MNVLFLTLLSFQSLQDRNLYTDLLREFVKQGHNVYVISPVEKRAGKGTKLFKEEKTEILRLKIGNTQKTNIIEKGISTVMIEPAFKKAIRKYFSDVKFDLVLYSTPPITLVSAIEYVKKRDGANTYLLLKDIFPQNAVDMGMMSTSGVRSILYKHFRKQEKKLYKISDRIGCMSQANVDYLLANDPEVKARDDESRAKNGGGIVEICPNSIDVIDKSVDAETGRAIREKYGIPQDKKVFVYGGNLGKPQGIPFLIDCLKSCGNLEDAYFLVVGDGTEYHVLEEYADRSRQGNLRIMKRLPKEDYDNMVGACDVGMIFLDHRFTIPNFPSRLLSYMQAKIPVLAVTDTNTDIGRVITDGGFGWWCESNNAEAFRKKVTEAMDSDLTGLGNNGFEYVQAHYDVKDSARVILDHFS